MQRAREKQREWSHLDVFKMAHVRTLERNREEAKAMVIKIVSTDVGRLQITFL